MKNKMLLTFSMALLITGTVFGQVSWLDQPLTRNWNTGSGVVPTAPRTGNPIEGICKTQVRTPESLSDRAVTRAGWSLYGPAYIFGKVTIVTAMASVDGMCRPSQYNGFVFVSNRFAGTLSPTHSLARSDGSLGRITLMEPTEMMAEFSRYTSQDALCCPSQTSLVTYSIGTGTRAVLKAEDVSTAAICNDGGIQTQDNVVSGTVTYTSRMALPPNAVLTVTLQNTSRAGASATTIAEERIPTRGLQVPFNFSFAYDRSKIVERNRYSIRAQITDGERLLFTSDTDNPVITQGNPRSVDITVVPVGSGGPGRGSQTIRGTVTYLQRIALPSNSEVTVKLVDAASPDTAIAETRVATNNRQVPISFELNYDQRDINRQRSYELWAEIRTDGDLKFRSETGQAVTLRDNRPDNVNLVVAPAQEEPAAITGHTLSLSKIGAGSLQIEGRGSELVVNVRVTVRTDGTASVAVTRPQGTITFDGKLVEYSTTALKIAVSNSGDADAGGDINVRYSGRNLNGISSADLVLDSQKVTLRF